jgi:hypothetical protein
MSITYTAWTLAGVCLLVAAQAGAQTVEPCAGAMARISNPAIAGGLQGSPTEQSEEARDRASYRQQVTEIYRQHLTVYAAQAEQLAGDQQLLQRFQAGFQRARLAAARDANADIARGIVPVDPSNGVATLTNPELQKRTNNTPVEIGFRDLETLQTNVAADRAAMRQSCEMLVEDQQILDRIDSAQ